MSYWYQLGLDIDGEAANDESGVSVSLSADGLTVAIGANSNDGTSGDINDDRGHVRVYKFQNGSWSQLGQDIDGEATADESGQTVSLSADGLTVAIGAPLNDGNGNKSGNVRVYKFQNGSWSQLGSDIDGEASNDRNGTSIYLSDDGLTVAVGAQFNDGSGSNSGHVRVYKFQNGSWTQIGSDIDGEAPDDRSGRSVSLSADGLTVAIGAYLNDGTSGITTDNRGHVRVYKFQNGSWVQMGSDIDGEATDDYSGWSVSLSSNGLTVAIGANKNDGTSGTLYDDRGHVRVYQFQNGSWVQIGQDINGEASGDQSGYSVSLSADGLTVAIGAYYNSGTNGNSNDYRGHVRVYQFQNGSWRQIGTDIDGEAYADGSGFSVSLSSDGQTVAIGALNNDGNGTNSGHVRVYKLVPPPPYSNTCFPSGTPVHLDQGIINIDKINPAIHTIRGNKVETVTQTITQDKYLVCIEKDALAKNIPSQKTLISKNHKLFYNGKMVSANDLLLLNSNNDKVYKVKYSGEVLYNILLDNEKHDKMIVNNLICETLDPKNGIATMYYDMKNANYSELEKANFIKEYNEYVIKNKTFRK